MKRFFNFKRSQKNKYTMNGKIELETKQSDDNFIINYHKKNSNTINDVQLFVVGVVGASSALPLSLSDST